MKVLFSFIFLCFGIFFSINTQAQFTSTKWDNVTNWDKVPRLEDHFWRKRVRFRVDMKEKINKPINETENSIYDEKSKIYNANKDKYEYRRGIIQALLEGYANGMIDGFRSDTLDLPLEFPQFKVLYDKRTDGGGGSEGGDDSGGGMDEEGDDWGFDDFEDESSGGSGESGGDDVIPIGPSSQTQFTDIPAFFDVIEDRIFDKNKSEMFYDLHYIILYATGSNNIDEPIVAFRYDDVTDIILNKCMWKNRFNDAEYKTLKEVFEFRLFNNYVLNVSGSEPKTVYEAEKRRLQMIEFEHNLWEF